MDDVFARYQAALRSGHQLAAEGKFKDALAQYEDAARVAGERVMPQVGIGGMLLRLGKPREALAAYDRALAIEANDVDALSGRAAALLATGRRAEAAAVQQHIAVQRDAPQSIPSTPAGMHSPWSRAETMAIAGEQAQAAGDTAAAIDAWLDEAREHAAAGSYDAAIDAALRALALDTGAARVHLELARIYAQRGWLDQARAHAASLRRLLELEPDAAVQPALDELELQLRPAAAPPEPPAQA
jgi:tetratricopeptide (TPR) repeat protein